MEPCFFFLFGFFFFLGLERLVAARHCNSHVRFPCRCPSLPHALAGDANGRSAGTLGVQLLPGWARCVADEVLSVCTRYTNRVLVT
jgi:hypothetical protein